MGELALSFGKLIGIMQDLFGSAYIVVNYFFGICAMIVTILSYQAKRRIGILIMQLIGHVCWVAYLTLNGAFVGALLNLISLFRAIVFCYKDKYKWAKSYFWLAFFIAISIAVTILAWSMWCDILPIVGQILFTIGFYMSNEKHIRILSSIALPLWLVYGIFTSSYFAVINDSISFVSVIIALIRFRKVANQEKLN